MTTRIRINIPGSRPIPPLVMRTPVEDRTPAGPGGDAEPGRPASSWNAVPAPEPAAEPVAEPEPASEPERTSDWFAPRKPGAAAPAPPLASGPARPPVPAPDGTQPSGPAGPQIPGGRRDPRPGARQDPARQDPAGPAPSGPYLAPPMGVPLGGTGPGPGPFDEDPEGAVWPGANPLAPQDPTFSDPAYSDPGFGDPAFGAPGGASGTADRNTPFPAYQPPAGMAPQEPAGPTSGPVTGGVRLPQTGPGGPGGPAGPGASSGPGAPAASGAPGGRVSGDTLVSGIPTVPSSGSRTPPAGGEDSYRFEADSTPAPKGRSKVILAGVVLVGLAGVAYGAGLLMDHSEVPKRTTVLGVDIGGKSRDDAVKSLDAKLGTRISAPLKVKIGARTLELKPSVAGLSVDNPATVRAVAHTDYNPVSVIGSLLGGARQAEPVLIEDDEKLKSALQNLSQQAADGSGSEGMVKFVNGKAVGVPGSPRLALDVDGSMKKVAAAYRTRAETGRDQPVELTATTVQPKVTQAEIDRALADFGKTAMAGIITVKTDGAHKVPFGPNKSLPKFLTMVADDSGKLQPSFDLAVLKDLYGKVFTGVLLERDNGTKTAVTPKDVADAMLPALQTADPSKKTVVIPHVAQ
ncbi:hypothetical protein QMK19_28130 [Streptomyces sp. H10-C2]|uniref:hypothetical protein n=1 Tax=unclassified Streptomyces TaxID=2593676 RepID=UPI0024BA742E|nr:MULTISPECIES: hypothetical protein [unclassified Streptomyces]MDJ0343827.1 hypothetical protein [Streptomyces sp. PH10-H1]MDJ0373416.1 hypothetical protein [Streptomyces sp. H10-C2]